MSMPLFSIVLPVKNGEKYLSSAIASIVNQSLKDFELIVVNDNSTDQTSAILDTWIKRDERIRVIPSNSTKKLPGALNTGFAAARGQWFTWTSHDNILEPVFLEVFFNALSTQGLDFAYSNYWLIDAEGKRTRLVEVRDSKYLHYENVVGASFAYSSRLAKLVGPYDESAFMFEDYDFWVRASKIGLPFERIQVAPYEYRLHDSQISRRIRLPRNYIDFRLGLLSNTKDNHTRELNLAFSDLVIKALTCEKPWLAFKVFWFGFRRGFFSFIYRLLELLVRNIVRKLRKR